MDLKPGFSIQTTDFKKVTVLPANESPNGKCPIGEGGQGAVYAVNFDGKIKALKWYSGTKIANPKKFYENLENNIKKGKPTEAFLWPEAITVKQGEAFGYIMDLRPTEYKDFTKFLLGREGFASLNAWVNSAMQIIEGFRTLHQKGYSYQDLNDGNFFINPQNGNVLICDNDNVSEYGKSSGIAGKARYMAPEIIVNGASKSPPDSLTDAFSLAVVLFLLWTSNHPLEGKATCPPAVPASTPELEKKFYGTNPVFVWDPDDDSNRPFQGLHTGAIIRWPLLPQYLREVFIKAFSKEVMHNPNKRVLEQEWLRIFIRMRSEVFKCPCGMVYFADPVNPNPCPKCKKTNKFAMYIKTPRYNVPVHQRTKLYACHTEKGSDDYKTLTAETAVNGSEYQLKNLSKNNWNTADGATIAPGSVVTLKKGTTVSFGLVNAEII